VFNVIRYSQIIGLIAIDSAMASQIGNVEEIWMDESGRVKYLSCNRGYWSLDQVVGVGNGAVSVYHCLLLSVPSDLHHWQQLPVRSDIGEPLGWVDDFLFDWHTGEVLAYILAGEIALPYGGQAVLLAEDVANATPEAIVVQAGTQQRLKSVSEGLQGFLSEKSDQVKVLVQEMVDRLHGLVSADDAPHRVRIKIKQVSEDLADEHEHHILQEATDFLHNHVGSLQDNIRRSMSRAQAALKLAWEEITSKKQR
jgi:uncharacterized protein YrrD